MNSVLIQLESNIIWVLPPGSEDRHRLDLGKSLYVQNDTRFPDRLVSFTLSPIDVIGDAWAIARIRTAGRPRIACLILDKCRFRPRFVERHVTVLRSEGVFSIGPRVRPCFPKSIETLKAA